MIPYTNCSECGSSDQQNRFILEYFYQSLQAYSRDCSLKYIFRLSGCRCPSGFRIRLKYSIDNVVPDFKEFIDERGRSPSYLSVTLTLRPRTFRVSTRYIVAGYLGLLRPLEEATMRQCKFIARRDYMTTEDAFVFLESRIRAYRAAVRELRDSVVDRSLDYLRHRKAWSEETKE